MNNRASLALLLIFSLFISIAAQQNPKPSTQTTPQQTTPQQGQVEKEDVVRITTNLVQVDAIVTDKSGKQVTDLKPEEMEIYEDGRQQKITNFSYISTESGTAQPVEVKKPEAPADKYAPPVPPVHLKPEQVRRTIAIVVDDLGLSFESTPFVRDALKKFVDRQVQPGDLVAILRTRGGVGALQQFTSDKRQLYATIDRIRWYPLGRSGVSAITPIDSSGGQGQQDQSQGPDLENGANKSVGEDIEQLREEFFTVGTLGALNYVVRGMRELPGRKSILLVSDGITIFNRKDLDQSRRVINSIHYLVDQANRASVIIYTMDARGLQTLGLTAADNTNGMSQQQIAQQLQSRQDSFNDSQDGLAYLAQQT
ncbi:MAG TPA: VWA domain-containing protein, partial [Pyrinomonadaceae bacterium]|nr:VWA domain-containing protein [Pyrinomonadaceae bacterium]